MQEYNCNGSIDSSYGASAYSTCSAEVGAPSTGFFQPFFSGGSFEILLPLAMSVVFAAVATIVVKRRKKRSNNQSTDA